MIKMLQTYLNNDNEKRIEMDKLAPDAKTKILKYTFYMKAVSSVNTLISQIIDQLESTKKKVENMEENRISDLNLLDSYDDILFKKPEAQRKRRKITQEEALEKIKISGENQHLFYSLSKEIFQHILGYLNLKELKMISLVDKLFYKTIGNEIRWKLICQSLALSEPLKSLNQTWKNVFAIYNLGKNKCQKCGIVTTRNLSPSWNIKICKSCQDYFFLDSTQAKQLYDISDNELLSLSKEENNSSIYLRENIEEIVIKKKKKGK